MGWPAQVGHLEAVRLAEEVLPLPARVVWLLGSAFSKMELCLLVWHLRGLVGRAAWLARVLLAMPCLPMEPGSKPIRQATPSEAATSIGASSFRRRPVNRCSTYWNSAADPHRCDRSAC